MKTIIVQTVIGALAAIAVFAGAVFAQTDGSSDRERPARGADSDRCVEVLASYLERAALENPDLKAAFERWKASLEQVPQVGALPDPRFSFAWFIREVETRVGPQKFRYGLSQTFPWWGTLDLREEVAGREAEAMRAEYDAARDALFFEVKDAFYEYAYLARAVEITEGVLELVRYLEQVASARYEAGATAYADVIRTQVELGRLEDRLATLRELRRPLQARLVAAMNLERGTTLPWPPTVPVMEIETGRDELLDRLAGSNPQLRALALRADKGRSSADLARKDYYPDVTLGLESVYTDEAENRNVEDSGKDPVAASISFNLPVWVDRNSAAVREAEALARAADRSREGLVDTLAARFELAHYKYEDARRKVNLYRDTLLPKADQSLGATLEAFQNGTRTSLDLIDAERTLFEFELSYTRALTDQAQRLAEMERILGEEIACRYHGSMRPAPASRPGRSPAGPREKRVRVRQ